MNIDEIINYIDWHTLLIDKELSIEFLDKYFYQIKNYNNQVENGLWYLIRNQQLTDSFILSHYDDLKYYFLNLKQYEVKIYMSIYTGNNYKIFESIHNKKEIFK